MSGEAQKAPRASQALVVKREAAAAIRCVCGHDRFAHGAGVHARVTGDDPWLHDILTACWKECSCRAWHPNVPQTRLPFAVSIDRGAPEGGTLVLEHLAPDTVTVLTVYTGTAAEIEEAVFVAGCDLEPHHVLELSSELASAEEALR